MYCCQIMQFLKFQKKSNEKLDQQYLIKIRKEAYGYRCLTNQKLIYIGKLSGCCN